MLYSPLVNLFFQIFVHFRLYKYFFFTFNQFIIISLSSIPFFQVARAWYFLQHTAKNVAPSVVQTIRKAIPEELIASYTRS